MGSTLTCTDPVFFLHHTQLDRIWWRWQQVNIEERQTQYLGPAAHGSEVPASLRDILPMGDLASGVTVSQVINTEDGLLCYRY